MPPATLAPLVALLGGSVWVLEWLLGPGGDPTVRTLHRGGLALLLVAVALAAAGLVAREVVALRLLVAAAAPALAWSVFEFFRPEAAGWYAGAWGMVAVVAAASALWRERTALVPAPRSAGGAHARNGSTRGGQPRRAHAR